VGTCLVGELPCTFARGTPYCRVTALNTTSVPLKPSLQLAQKLWSGCPTAPECCVQPTRNRERWQMDRSARESGVSSSFFSACHTLLELKLIFLGRSIVSSWHCSLREKAAAVMCTQRTYLTACVLRTIGEKLNGPLVSHSWLTCHSQRALLLPE
jgi:hypothetical protein